MNKTAPVVDYETPYKMIRTSNVRNGRVNTFDVRYVTKETYEQWTRRGAPLKGDVILTREAPVGEVGILENAEGIFLGQRLMMYRANKKIADNYYLFYSLSSAFCQKQIEDYSNGGTVAHMRVPDCGEILVNLPPLLEQQKIAQVLSTWDQAISTTEKLLENSQQQKKALMQQLLTGSKRLLAEKNVKFSGLWVSNDINSIFDICRGSVQETLEFGKYYLVVMGSISETGKLVIKESTNSQADLLKYGDLVMPERDIGKGLIIGRTALIQEDGKYILGPNVLRLRVKDFKKHNSKFWNYLFNSTEVRRKVKRLVSGTGQLMLTGKEIKNIRITFPSDIEEQKKIAEVLEISDQEIEALQKKLDCLKQEKKALMQQLLTGKKRVKVAA